jgi:hypothetical protein
LDFGPAAPALVALPPLPTLAAAAAAAAAALDAAAADAAAAAAAPGRGAAWIPASETIAHISLELAAAKCVKIAVAHKKRKRKTGKG